MLCISAARPLKGTGSKPHGASQRSVTRLAASRLPSAVSESMAWVEVAGAGASSMRATRAPGRSEMAALRMAAPSTWRARVCVGGVGGVAWGAWGCSGAVEIASGSPSPERLEVELAAECVARHHRQLAAVPAAVRRRLHLLTRGFGGGGEVAAEAEPA
eukprot:scaffold114084_cov63-Phaeocystis_antarctica.AAC.2